MTDIIIKVMVEVLLILALVTKEIKQGKLSELILDDRQPCSSWAFCRKILEEGSREVGDRWRAAEAGQPDARRTSDGDCAKSEGHTRRS
jgi:hypothetical protein